MWKNTSHFGTNNSTIRPGGILGVIAEDNGKNNWKQHNKEALKDSTEHFSIK